MSNERFGLSLESVQKIKSFQSLLFSVGNFEKSQNVKITQTLVAKILWEFWIFSHVDFQLAKNTPSPLPPFSMLFGNEDWPLSFEQHCKRGEGDGRYGTGINFHEGEEKNPKFSPF